MAQHTREELAMKQALPLDVKIKMTETRIKDWVDVYGLDGVYISFSGGKDSTVLLTIARNLFPNIKAVFCGFGCHLEKEGNGRFELMKLTHPKQYEYIMKPWCEGGLDYKNVIDWLNEHGDMNIKY